MIENGHMGTKVGQITTISCNKLYKSLANRRAWISGATQNFDALFAAELLNFHLMHQNDREAISRAVLNGSSSGHKTMLKWDHLDKMQLSKSKNSSKESINRLNKT
jgi:hypothetical protein